LLLRSIKTGRCFYPKVHDLQQHFFRLRLLLPALPEPSPVSGANEAGSKPFARMAASLSKLAIFASIWLGRLLPAGFLFANAQTLLSAGKPTTSSAVYSADFPASNAVLSGVESDISDQCDWRSLGYVRSDPHKPCATAGFSDVQGDAKCVAAAESVGYDFTITRVVRKDATPVLPVLRTGDTPCAVCTNMIYTGRPDMLFLGGPELDCDQNGEQGGPYYICESKARRSVAIAAGTDLFWPGLRRQGVKGVFDPPENLITSFLTVLIVEFRGRLPTLPSF
jgi:hypothetical protein